MLKDIKSQPRALKILIGTLQKKRLPTSILMSGQRGIGKRLTAMNYAKAINCYEPVDFDSCDKCVSCHKIDSLIHPDIHILEPENGEIKIDSIRKLQEKLSLKPFEGKRKFAIIDEAQNINESAANAFLKTLEEPPDNTTIALICSNDDLLPPTIKSRCVSIGFSPLSTGACREIISARYSGKDIDLYVNLSMGMPGIAITRNFSEEKEWFLALLRNMINDCSKEIWADREQIKTWLNLAMIFIRDSIVCSITNNRGNSLLGETYECLSVQRALNIYEQCQELLSLIDSNLNRNIVWNYASGIMKSFMKGGAA